jgi:hypothetical protein
MTTLSNEVLSRLGMDNTPSNNKNKIDQAWTTVTDGHTSAKLCLRFDHASVQMLQLVLID